MGSLMNINRKWAAHREPPRLRKCPIWSYTLFRRLKSKSLKKNPQSVFLVTPSESLNKIKADIFFRITGCLAILQAPSTQQI